MSGRNVLQFVSAVAIVATIIFGIFAFGLPSLGTKQNARAEEDVDQTIRDAFYELGLRNFKQSQWQRTIGSIFRRYDRDGDGLSAEELRKHQSRARAALNQFELANLLLYDQNADFTISREEVEEIVSFYFPQGTDKSRNRIAKEVDKIMSADPNNDDKVEPVEFSALRSSGPRYEYPRKEVGRLRLIEMLMRSDPNGDDRLTNQEIINIGTRIFADGKGASFNPRERSKKLYHAEGRRRTCRAPQASRDSEILVVGALKAGSLSNIKTANNILPGTTATIKIEQGYKPLHVVLISFGPIIWRFEGATERVDQVLLSTFDSKKRITSGVTGLPAQKIAGVPSIPCKMQLVRKGKIFSTKNAERQLKDLIGRPANRGFAFETIGEISLPSGDHISPKDTEAGASHSILEWVDQQTEKLKLANETERLKGAALATIASDLKRSYPGGIVDIVPESIVSKLPAKRVKTLPGTAGLIQLLMDKAIEVGPSGNFFIARKIQFPSHFEPKFHKNFLLLPGVPEPDFIPRNICLFSVDRRAHTGWCPR